MSPVARVYGYSTCLAAVLAALVSVNSGVDTAIYLAAPGGNAHGMLGNGPAAFDAWLAARGRYAESVDTASAPALRTRFQALQHAEVTANRFAAQVALAGDAARLLLAILLFTAQWRWLHHPARPPSVRGAA